MGFRGRHRACRQPDKAADRCQLCRATFSRIIRSSETRATQIPFSRQQTVSRRRPEMVCRDMTATDRSPRSSPVLFSRARYCPTNVQPRNIALAMPPLANKHPRRGGGPKDLAAGLDRAAPALRIPRCGREEGLPAAELDTGWMRKVKNAVFPGKTRHQTEHKKHYRTLLSGSLHPASAGFPHRWLRPSRVGLSGRREIFEDAHATELFVAAVDQLLERELA